MVDKIATVIQFASVIAFLIGGAALDGPDWIVGIIIMLGGMALGCIGYILKGLDEILADEI